MSPIAALEKAGGAVAGEEFSFDTSRSKDSIVPAPVVNLDAAPAFVEGELIYLDNDGRQPYNYTYDPPPPGEKKNSHEGEAHKVKIHNARLETDLSLDTSGFQLLNHRSALGPFKDYQDDAKLREVYYPEVEAAIRAVTGAEKVVIFDHTVRDSSGQEGVREPVRRVHDDQTFDSAPSRVTKHLPAEEAAERLKKRFAIINFWRPIGGPVEQWPLALGDARTIKTKDLVISELRYKDWTGHTYAVNYSPDHKFFYYPRLTPEEVVLIKVFDSKTDGTARLSAHTAFDDPTSPKDAPPRRSIEIRTLVFWP